MVDRQNLTVVRFICNRLEGLMKGSCAFLLDENIVAGWATERIAGIELQKAEGDTFTTFYSYEGTIGTSCELTFEDCSAEKIRLVITSLQPDTSANSQGQTDPSLREVALYYKPESTN